jgi:putative transposase
LPYTRLYYHLVWSTKNRADLITPSQESCLFSYLCLKAGELECKILGINGCSDHIHLILEIHPKLSVSEVVKRLKGSSSHQFADIQWQRSYGALTVSERSLEAALSYVNQQKDHHQDNTQIARYELCEDEFSQ